MRIAIINGNIITYNGIIKNGYVLIEDGIIIKIGENVHDEEIDIIINCNDLYVAPGFIDLHVHGGGGYDFMDETPEAFEMIACTHLKYGTTTLMPTTLTGSKEQILNILRCYKDFKKSNFRKVTFLGLHLEGPYFAMEQRGAQNPKYIRNPDIKEIENILLFEEYIKRWSIAPELPGALMLGKLLSEKKIIAAIAHTNALYDDVVLAFKNGYNLITHLYSAMNGVVRKKAYRYAGTIEAAFLNENLYVEIIADGKHLPAPLLQLVYKIKGPDKIALITDAMRAAGTEVTKSILGRLDDGVEVIIEDGVAKLPDRTSFAGSVATTNLLVKTMWKDAGIDLVDVIKMMSTTPAKIAGIDHEVGSIALNKKADLVIFDLEVNIKKVLKNGIVLEDN
ncbi:N-acetylglucosamine-6-phosphate deacetylase [Hydrotalea sp.]|uniref:N-acetylglucosamine-6-phosphate deacetylase n=1 Tax=Hydrotalea sp. TaxID=2881279 RepID=UPI003D0B2276